MPAIAAEDMPAIFTHADARSRGVSDRVLYGWRDRGQVEQLARGIFVQPDLPADPDLSEIAVRAPDATLCLTTALARHGLVDDMKSLRVFQKLTIQIVAALVLAVSGFLLFTGIPVVDELNAVILLVSVVFLVGISSAVNLIDGHDGLAAGICLIAATSFAVMAVMFGANTVLVVALALCGACLGFLVFNFPPGKIFMGDTGSMFLGIMLALIACSLTTLNPNIRTFVATCFILGIPMLDAFLAITRRLLLRSPVFKADNLHMHHVLRELSFSPKQTLLVMYSMQAFLAALGLLVLKGFVFPVIIGLAFVAVVFVSFLRIMVIAGTIAPAAPKLASESIPPLKSNMPRQNTSLGR